MFPYFELLERNTSGSFDILNRINLLFCLSILVELTSTPNECLSDLLTSRVEDKTHIRVYNCSCTVAVFLLKHASAVLVWVEKVGTLITIKFHELGIGKLAFVVWIKLVKDQLLFCGWKSQSNSVASRFKLWKTNFVIKWGVEKPECFLQIFEPLLNPLPENFHKLTRQIIASLTQTIAYVCNLGHIKRCDDVIWWLVLFRPYHKRGKDKKIEKTLQKIKFYYLLSSLFWFLVHQYFQ